MRLMRSIIPLDSSWNMPFVFPELKRSKTLGSSNEIDDIHEFTPLHYLLLLKFLSQGNQTLLGQHLQHRTYPAVWP